MADTAQVQQLKGHILGSVLKRIQDAIAAAQAAGGAAPGSPATPAPSTPAAGSKNVLDILKTLIAELFADGKVTAADAHVVSTAAEELFDEFVVPLDIPGVPNVFEPAIKSLVRGAIRPLVTQAFAHLPAAA